MALRKIKQEIPEALGFGALFFETVGVAMVTMLFNPAIVAGIILALGGVEPAGWVCLGVGVVLHLVLMKVTIFAR